MNDRNHDPRDVIGDGPTSDVESLREACAHLAGVLNVYQVQLQHPSDAVVRWALLQDYTRDDFESCGRQCSALYVTAYGVRIGMIVYREDLLTI